MKARVSKRGYIVIPSSLVEEIACEPGDHIKLDVRAGRIVIMPVTRPRKKARIIVDKLAGIPVLTAGPGAPILTSKYVRDLLEFFP
jgi:AbrB family looped-hinge helix DNA binding protein